MTSEFNFKQKLKNKKTDRTVGLNYCIVFIELDWIELLKVFKQKPRNARGRNRVSSWKCEIMARVNHEA